MSAPEYEGEVVLAPPMSGSALAAATKSEIEAVVETAHKYPRAVSRALAEAEASATIDEDTAASCEYRRPAPGGGDPIVGPSVRLAEIIAASYGNLYTRVQLVDVGERIVTVRGIAWDTEKNQRVEQEVSRSIWGKKGRYGDSLIQTTIAAASSIALRNAIFRVVPRAFVNRILAKAREVARGDVKTLDRRRADAIEHLAKNGIEKGRVLAFLGRDGVADITLDDLLHLRHALNTVRSGEATYNDVFPAVEKDIPEPAPKPVVNLADAAKKAQSKQAAKTAEPVAEKPAAPAPKEPEPAAAAETQAEPPDAADDEAGASSDDEPEEITEGRRRANADVRRRLEALQGVVAAKGLVAPEESALGALTAFMRTKKLADLGAAYPKIMAGTLTDGEAIEIGAALMRAGELLEKVRSR